MCANSTGRAQAFLSASDAAVSREVADGKISIQSARALNTRYVYFITTYLPYFGPIPNICLSYYLLSFFPSPP
jgi:hypothetical protein